MNKPELKAIDGLEEIRRNYCSCEHERKCITCEMYDEIERGWVEKEHYRDLKERYAMAQDQISNFGNDYIPKQSAAEYCEIDKEKLYMLMPHIKMYIHHHNGERCFTPKEFMRYNHDMVEFFKALSTEPGIIINKKGV